ncbi:MAG: GNAT family N-acetyltransferase [Planctomycetes bacterium]|nr:GNAT family N-acetyltransferase [Planctomycetota bacterium]
MGTGIPPVTPTKPLRTPSPRDVFSADAAPRIVHGRAGDHPAVRQLLQTVFQAKSAVAFQSQIDDPFYEPSDRLLMKQGRRVIAHLHIVKRAMYFAHQKLPVAGIESLATLPESQGQGHATRLLHAARTQMLEDGGLITTLNTPQTKLFAREGFFTCGRHSYSQADVRSVLAHMPEEQSSLLGPKRAPLNIRLWRHFELPALMRLYRQNMPALIGPLHRSEAYWRWLISREAFDKIVIAIDGPDRLSLEEGSSPIVGYAVVKGDQILELMTKPGHPTVARQLLGRVCGEAIEHDFNSLVLHAPPQEPLHELLVLAGGSYHCPPAARHEVFMFSLLVDVATLLGRLCDPLHFRAKAVKLSRPCQLGLKLDDETFCMQLTRRSVKVASGSLGRNFLRASQVDFLRLLFGHHRLEDAIAGGQIECSTRIAEKMALVVCPNVSLWRPPWDRLPG